MSINVKCVGRYSAFLLFPICDIPVKDEYGIWRAGSGGELQYLIFDTGHTTEAQRVAGKKVLSGLSSSSPKSILRTGKANIVGDKNCIQQSVAINGVVLPSNWDVQLRGVCPDRVYSYGGSFVPSTLIEGREYYDILIPLAKDASKTYTLAKNVIGILGLDFSMHKESLTIDGLGREFDDSVTTPFSITFSHKEGSFSIGISSSVKHQDYDFGKDSYSWIDQGIRTSKLSMFLNTRTYSLRNNTLRGSLVAGDSPALIKPLSGVISFPGLLTNEDGETDGTLGRITEEVFFSHQPDGLSNSFSKRSVEEINLFGRSYKRSPSGFINGSYLRLNATAPSRKRDIDNIRVDGYYDPNVWNRSIFLPGIFVSPATLCPDELTQDTYDVDSILAEYHAAGIDETSSVPGATVSDLISHYWYHPDASSTNILHDAVVKALENLKYTDVNTPAFLLEDVVDLIKMAGTIASYVRQPGKAVRNVKRLKKFLNRKGGKFSKIAAASRKTADGYLNYRFGLPLTVADIRQMIKDYHRHSKRAALSWKGQKFFSGRSRATLSSQQFPDTQFCCKIYVRQYDENWKSLLQYLYRTNLYLSAQNTWDLIPFSFVVDWIIPVNKLMKYVDINTYDRALPVVSVLYSLKCVKPTDGVDFKASHLCLVTSTKYYIRWSEGQLPDILYSVPSLSLNVDKNILLHTIDATALAIQHSDSPRLKR